MFMHAKRLTNCPKKHLELVIYLEKKEIRQHNQRILKKGRVTAKRFKLILFRKIAFKQQQQISLRTKL